MFKRIKVFLLGLVLTTVALFTFRRHAESRGREDERNRQLRDASKSQREADDHVRDADDHVRRVPEGDMSKRLKDDWSRSNGHE